MALLAHIPAAAQWSGVHEQTYLPASHNWSFRDNFVSADRLFNAFDYGHAILYETLYTRSGAPPSLLEVDVYNRLTRDILVRPPRLPVEEAAVAVQYAKLVPEAKAMFDWAHVLHRQVYDVWADEAIAAERKDARIAELLRYYRSRPDIAFSTQPKHMDLMEAQYYSKAFREHFPKFNGLIWAYHWLQVGLYEPLVTGATLSARKAGVDAAVARFWQMLEQAPQHMPRVMPMTAAIAPSFAARYPEIAIIFDNLHSLHDVISDILANTAVPAERKRAEILKAAALYRDDAAFVTTRQEWLDMAQAMGVANMGGPATGLLGAPPAAPTGAHEGHAMPAQPTAAAHAGHAAAGPSAQSDSAAVIAVIERFHRALQEGDSATVLQLLAPDVRILEAGNIETKEQYRSGHLRADINASRSAQSERTVLQVIVRGDAAFVTSRSVTRREAGGQTRESQGAESMVLIRSAEGWLISAIHWSSRGRAGSPAH
jgi:ketosteroid isomerase-like protein